MGDVLEGKRKGAVIPPVLEMAIIPPVARAVAVEPRTVAVLCYKSLVYGYLELKTFTYSNKRQDSSVSASNQTNSKVSDSPMLDKGKKKVSSSDKSQTAQHMLGTLLRLVTVETVSNNDKDGKDVGRDSHELTVFTLKAERCDNRGGKVSKGVERVGHEEVGNGEEPEEVVGDGLFGDLAVPVLVVHGGCVGA